MKSINDISDYLKKSQLYLNLNHSSDTMIDDKYFLDNKPLSINSPKEFNNLLEIFRYWMLDECPHELYDYVIKNKNMDFSKTFKNFHDLPFIADLKILQSCCDKEWLEQTELFEHIAKNNHLYLLQYCHDNKIITEYHTDNTHCVNKPTFVKIMIEHGNIEILKYIRDNYKVDLGDEYEFLGIYCEIAARYGQLYVLKFLFESCFEKITAGTNSLVFALLARTRTNNHFECFKYLYDKLDSNYLANQHTSYYCSDVARNKNFEFFKYLVEKGFSITNSNYPSEYNVNYIVAKNGCFEILKYMYEIDQYIWTPKITSYATANQLDCVEIIKFYHEHDNDCFSLDILKNAAKNNNFKCFKYLIDQKIFEQYNIVTEVVQSRNVEMLKYLIDHGSNIERYIQESANIIIKYGTCDMLKLIHQLYINFSPNKELSERNFSDAVMFNNLAMIKYLDHCQCPVPDNVYSLAIAKMTDKGIANLYDTLRGYEKNFEDEEICLKILKFLFKKGYNCSENAYMEALEYYEKRSECFDFLLDNNIKWNSEVCDYTASLKLYFWDENLLKILYEKNNTIRWTFDGYIQAIKNLNPISLEYMLLNDAKDKITYTQKQVDKLYKTLAKHYRHTYDNKYSKKIFDLLNGNFEMSSNVYQYALRYSEPNIFQCALRHNVKPIKLYYDKVMKEEYNDDRIESICEYKRSIFKTAYKEGFIFDKKLYKYYHCYIKNLD